MSQRGYGEVTGGGSQLSESNEIEYCDIEISLHNVSEEITGEIINQLELCGAPKGSRLIISATGEEISFGVTEGLGIYLNGVDLSREVYEQADINHLIAELHKTLGSEGKMHSHWQGPSETALYFYGGSYDTMQNKLSDLINSYPLCEKCRVIQLA